MTILSPQKNVDYYTLRLNVESSVKGQKKLEYRLTSDFAKQLCMTVKNERGQQARQYFIACEQGLKIATQKLQNNANTVNDKTIELLMQMNDRILKLEESVVKESASKKLPEKKYSRWKTNTFDKLNTLLSYVNEHSNKNMTLSNIIHLVISETEDTYFLEINDYVDAYKSEFFLDSEPYAIDVINHYKDVKDAFTKTLDSIFTRLHITEEMSQSKYKNIFDELAANLETSNV